MTKLSKGLTLIAGGTPAAAILSACVLNAAPQTSHTHLAAEPLAVPKASSSEAMIQPKSLESRPARPITSPPHDARKPGAKHARARHAKVAPRDLTRAERRVADKVVAFAEDQLGTPYVFGGESHAQGFDCSGLVMAAYGSAGVNLPRTSDTQYWFGKRIAPGTERPGDLVFFDYKRGHTGPGHVGIVVDPAKGLMIVAPHTGTVVKYESYRTYPGGAVGFTRPTLRQDVRKRITQLAR
jgi:cell wall-associated NlpC family hydrolase